MTLYAAAGGILKGVLVGTQGENFELLLHPRSFQERAEILIKHNISERSGRALAQSVVPDNGGAKS